MEKNSIKVHMRKLRNKISFSLSNFTHRVFPASSIFYARKVYGYPWPDLISAWRQAKDFKPSSFQIADTNDRAVEFFSILAERAYDEAERYRCIEGCCVVLWHPVRGNMGGGGPAGCPCDNQKDPRDLTHGPLSN